MCSRGRRGGGGGRSAGFPTGLQDVNEADPLPVFLQRYRGDERAVMCGQSVCACV